MTTTTKAKTKTTTTKGPATDRPTTGRKPTIRIAGLTLAALHAKLTADHGATVSVNYLSRLVSAGDRLPSPVLVAQLAKTLDWTEARVRSVFGKGQTKAGIERRHRAA